MKASSHRLRRGRAPRAVLAAGLAAVLGAAWFLTRPDPAKLIEQGLTVGRRDPAAGERIVRRALESSGGRNPDAQIALCLLLGKQGAWEAAFSQFASLDTAACRADLLLAFGRQAFEAQQGPPALQVLEAVRARGTRESAEALDLLIANYREWGQTDELIAAARELIRLKPQDARPWSLLIQLLKGETRRDVECLKAIREALDQDLPEDARREFQHRLVEQLIVCGDAAAARLEWDKLRQTEGDSFRLRTYDIDLCRLEGKLDEALTRMNGLFDEVRDQAQASLNRGVIYLDMRRYDEAARDLERAVAGDPHNAAAHFKLSEAYRGLGRSEPARRQREIADSIGQKRGRITLLLKRLSREPQNGRIYWELADLYEDLGDAESAAQWKRRAERLVDRPPAP